MGISSQLKLAVISLFKKSADNDTRRFQNLASFLGIDLKPKKGSKEPVSKESSDEDTSAEKDAAIEVDARAEGKVKEEIRNWFLKVMDDYLPIGYFDEKKRDTNEDRERIFQYLPDDLFDRMSKKIRQIIGEKANSQGYKGLSTDDLVLDDAVIDNKLIDMLGYYQDNKASLESVISKSFSPPKTDTAKGKKFEPGPGEMWFTPMVSEALYGNYKKYLEENKEALSQRSQEKGTKELTTPEDLGVFKNKADPHIIKILKELGKFNIDIQDEDISTDPKEKTPTIAITFAIPELAKQNPKLYGDILFVKKLPAKMRRLRPYKDHPVTVQYSGDKGLGIRFAEIYKEWEENTSEALKKYGFTDHEAYRKFISNFVDTFSQEDIRKGKNLDEIIANLGGSIAIREKGDEKDKVITISSARDLEDVMGFGGKELTKEEMKSKRKTEQVKKRYNWQESIVKDKLTKVMDVWSPKIQEYLFKVTPEDGKSMRETITRNNKLLSIKDFIEDIKSGISARIGFNNLINTKEVADKALQFIFDEKTDPGEYAWKALLTDYITSRATESPLFTDAIRILLYKDFLDSTGKKGAALKTALKNASWDDIRKKYSDMDVSDFLRGNTNAIAVGLTTLNKSIGEIIKASSTHPSFKMFFDRIKTWNDIIGRDIERKVENIIDDASLSPIKIKPDMKAKMISEHEEQDPRNVDDLKKLETAKADLENRLKEEKKDPASSEELKKINEDITNIKNRANKKEQIDVTTPEGSKFLDKLVEYLIEERLQKAYIKHASYLNIIKLAKNSLK